jgi:hypothetical protein
MIEWIDPKNKLPEQLKRVLIKVMHQDEILIGYLNGNIWVEQCECFEVLRGDAEVSFDIATQPSKDFYAVINWAYLPELPPQIKD